MEKIMLLNTQPKECEKILTGEKTVDIQRNLPNFEAPFKCYIYCSEQEKILYRTDDAKNFLLALKEQIKAIKIAPEKILSGKVVGEFICDKTVEILNDGAGFYLKNGSQAETNELAAASCLYYQEMKDYLGNENGYGLYISELKIYDTPKQLEELELFTQDNIDDSNNSSDFFFIIDDDGHAFCLTEQEKDSLFNQKEKFIYFSFSNCKIRKKIEGQITKYLLSKKYKKILKSERVSAETFWCEGYYVSFEGRNIIINYFNPTKESNKEVTHILNLIIKDK